MDKFEIFFLRVLKIFILIWLLVALSLPFVCPSCIERLNADLYYQIHGEYRH